MAWINEEYAAEVAVVTTWLATVLPWSASFASYTGNAPVESFLVFLRFPVFEVQARLPGEVTVNGEVVDAGIPELLTAQYGGIQLFGSVYLGVPPLRIGDVSGLVTVAHALWSVATLLMLALLVLSVATYLREDAIQARLPIDYVSLTAIGFAVLALLLLGSTAAFALADAPYGTPVPIGVILLAAFAIVLWRADRVDAAA